METTTSHDRFAEIRDRLHTPVLGDILDQVGRTRQFLPVAIRPMRPGMVVVGRAMPTLSVEVRGPQQQPFGRLTEALDQLQPGEVYLGQGLDLPCAIWGEILTETALQRGVTGAVINGYHRDTRQMLALDFPVFSRGGYGHDASIRASLVGYRVPVEVGGVIVRPGDLLVGDSDGVVVVPRDVEDEVVERALTKVSAENQVLSAIRSGVSSTEAFARYGVL